MSKNEIQVFKNKEFGEIRTIQIDNELWFVGKDVAEALGYINTKKAIRDHVVEEDKRFFRGNDLLPLNVGNFGATLINESGVYSLILSSKLPKAKDFKHWVTSEILPSIRKHGAYLTPETIKKTLADPDYIIGIISALKDEQERNAKLTATVENLNNDVKCLTEESTAKDKVIAQQSTEIEQAKPKVEFYDTVAVTNGNLSVAEYAKLLCKNGANVGQNRLFAWLRDKGYLRYNNEPYQQYVNAGYFYVNEYTLCIKGVPTVGTKTLITGKGQQYFYKKIMTEFSNSAEKIEAL